MAFSHIGDLGTALSTANNQATLVLTTTAAAAVGTLVVVLVADDNNQTTDGDSTATASVADSAGNTYTRAKEFANGQGTVQTGADIGIFYSKLTAALPSGGTITATFTSATNSDATAMTAKNFAMTPTSNVAIEGTPGGLADDAANAGSLDVTTANIACLRVRAIASESNSTTALIATSSWALFAQAVSGAGTSATEMGVRGEWIISTGTGAASAPTGGAGAVDHASAYVAFKEVAATTDNKGWNLRVTDGVTTRGKVALLSTAVIATTLPAYVPQVPPAAAASTGAFVSDWAGPIVSRQLQHQTVARPVAVQEAAAETRAEFGWYSQFSSVSRPVSRIHLQGGVVRPAPPAEIVQIAWQAPLAVPVVKVSRVHLANGVAWNPQVVAAPAAPSSGAFVSSWDGPLLGRSFQYQSKVQAPQPISAAAGTTTPSEFGWQQSFAVPLRSAGSVEYDDFVFIVPDEPLNVSWLVPFTQPKPKRATPWLYPQPTFTFQTAGGAEVAPSSGAFVSDWSGPVVARQFQYQATARPVRAEPGAVTPSELGWQREFSRPIKKPDPLQFWNAWTAVQPGAVTPFTFGWQQQFEPATRRKVQPPPVWPGWSREPDAPAAPSSGAFVSDWSGPVLARQFQYQAKVELFGQPAAPAVAPAFGWYVPYQRAPIKLRQPQYYPSVFYTPGQTAGGTVVTPPVDTFNDGSPARIPRPPTPKVSDLLRDIDRVKRAIEHTRPREARRLIRAAEARVEQIPTSAVLKLALRDTLSELAQQIARQLSQAEKLAAIAAAEAQAQRLLMLSLADDEEAILAILLDE